MDPSIGEAIHINKSTDMHSASQRERMQAGPEQISIMAALIVALVALAALVG